MRKSIQALVMVLMASSLMPLMARPHHHSHKKHQKASIVQHHRASEHARHGHHSKKYKARRYRHSCSQHKHFRYRRPHIKACTTSVVSYYEPIWGCDIKIVQPRMKVSVHF